VGFAELLATADKVVRKQLGRGDVTWTPGAGAPVPNLIGILDQAYEKVDAGTPGISSFGPAVFLTLADLPVGAKDDEAARVTVGATVYSIHESQPDGLGGCVFLLHLV